MTVLLPSGVADTNWFLLTSWVPAGIVVLLLHPKWRLLPLFQHVFARQPALRVYLIWGFLFLTALLLVIGVVLEMYHTHDCPNSVVFQSEIASLARFVYEFCAREQVSFWVTFGNLLFVLRGQQRIPVGDTDSDIAVQKRIFLDHFSSISNFTSVVQRKAYLELQREVYVTYHSERDLVQIYLSPDFHGSHADIWLYTEEKDALTGKTQWLVNNDRTIRAKRLPYDQVLPLSDELYFFLNVPVTMPRNATFVAEQEYGKSFMTPLTTRLECVENFFNGYTFYHANRARNRFLWLVFLVTMALTLGIAYLVPELNRVLLKANRSKGRAWLEVREKDFV